MQNFVLNDIKNAFRAKNYLYQVIIINAAVFLVVNITLAFSGPATDMYLLKMIGLSANVKESLLHFWGYFTYMVVHQRFFHLLFNMLWIYWIGRIFADLYGQKRFMQVYVLGGLAGGIFFVLTSQLLPTMSTDTFLIGASGSVMAILVATAILLPDYTLHLILIGPVKLKYVALVGFILTSVLDLDLNTGGKMAHFGGAIYGLSYGYLLMKGKDINEPIVGLWSLFISKFKKKSKLKVVHRGTQKEKKANSNQVTSDADKQKKIDAILDKISKSGYDSLTRAEKDFLFKASNS